MQKVKQKDIPKNPRSINPGCIHGQSYFFMVIFSAVLIISIITMPELSTFSQKETFGNMLMLLFILSMIGWHFFEIKKTNI